VVFARKNFGFYSRGVELQPGPPPLAVPPLNSVGRPGLYLCRPGPQVVSHLLLIPAGEGIKILQELPQFGVGVQAVWLVLVLLNLGDDLRNLAALGEVYQVVRVVQKVRISLLQEQNVCLVLPKERNAGGVDGPQLVQVQLEVVRHQAGRVLQRFQQM